MLRGGALFYALAITLVMALVSASLLLSAYYARLQLQRDESREVIIRNSSSGLALLLSTENDPEFTTGKDIDLFGKGSDSAWLCTKPWGAFEIAITRAHNKSFTHERIAATGWKENEADQTALVLADLDRPLSITGNTKLTGDCYLPKAGIQRAYIEGQSYAGDKMVYGTIKNAERYLPAYNEELVKQLQLLFDFHPGEEDSVLSAETALQSDSISQSFSKQPLYIFSNGIISIRSQKITGQVCIISATAIYVGKNATLENVLLVAPYIEIEDETNGAFQAFARDSLTVGENVELHYPTVLGIIASKKSPPVAAIHVGEKTTVYGELFACSTENDYRKHVLISIAKTALIYGGLYSSDLIDLKGSVYGTVCCSKFELKTNSASYENHLMHAVIDLPKRSPYFIGSALTRKKTGRKAVVQWLQ